MNHTQPRASLRVPLFYLLDRSFWSARLWPCTPEQGSSHAVSKKQAPNVFIKGAIFFLIFISTEVILRLVSVALLPETIV